MAERDRHVCAMTRDKFDKFDMIEFRPLIETESERTVIEGKVTIHEAYVPNQRRTWILTPSRAQFLKDRMGCIFKDSAKCLQGWPKSV